MAQGKFVAYYRVSTKGQGESGLGLEAQQVAVSAYLKGCNGELVEEFKEVESATRKGNGKRPMLEQALAACMVQKATLLIAKLDRLYRNVAAQSALMESKVDFIAIDNANATKLTLHILAAVAENEAETVSQRTTVALAARAAKGLPMGAQCWKSDKGLLTAENREKGRTLAAHTNREKADAAARMIAAKIEEVKQATGVQTYHEIAQELNKLGITTPGKGKAWAYSSVRNVMMRVEANARTKRT